MRLLKSKAITRCSLRFAVSINETRQNIEIQNVLRLRDDKGTDITMAGDITRDNANDLPFFFRVFLRKVAWMLSNAHPRTYLSPISISGNDEHRITDERVCFYERATISGSVKINSTVSTMAVVPIISTLAVSLSRNNTTTNIRNFPP